MLRARQRLAANVFENNIAADNSKDTLYTGRSTVRQDVLQPRQFRRTPRWIAIAGDDQMRVFFDGRQAGTVRYFERQPGSEKRLVLLLKFLFRLPQAFGQMHESFFKFAAKNRGDSSVRRYSTFMGA